MARTALESKLRNAKSGGGTAVNPAAGQRYVVPAVQAQSIPGLVWPSLPNASATEILALRFQLERGQWWPESRLRAAQFEQLKVLLDHAVRVVPHYRDSLPRAGYDAGRPLTPDLWSSLPILTRPDVQGAGRRLLSE